MKTERKFCGLHRASRLLAVFAAVWLAGCGGKAVSSQATAGHASIGSLPPVVVTVESDGTFRVDGEVATRATLRRLLDAREEQVTVHDEANHRAIVTQPVQVIIRSNNPETCRWGQVLPVYYSVCERRFGDFAEDAFGALITLEDVPLRHDHWGDPILKKPMRLEGAVSKPSDIGLFVKRAREVESEVVLLTCGKDTSMALVIAIARQFHKAEIGVDISYTPFSADTEIAVDVVRRGIDVIFAIDASGFVGSYFEEIREELNTALFRMEGRERFHVVFYSQDGAIEGPGKGLVKADDEHKRDAIKFVKYIKASGQTSSPIPALEAAFKAFHEGAGNGVRLLYLLTNGGFETGDYKHKGPDGKELGGNEAVIAWLAANNKDKSVHVCPIILGKQPSDETEEAMRHLANENGGWYMHVTPKYLAQPASAASSHP